MVFLFIYFMLNAWLVLKVLGEIKPMRKPSCQLLLETCTDHRLVFLVIAVIFFAGGQIFDFIASVHICNGVHGKIDGSLFQTFCTLIAVIMVWVFWSSITEDDWPTPAEGEQPYQEVTENRPHVATLA